MKVLTIADVDEMVRSTLTLLVAFALRIHNLTIRPLWFDVAMEYWVGTAPLGDLFSVVRNSLPDAPFFSLILHS